MVYAVTMHAAKGVGHVLINEVDRAVVQKVIQF